MKSRTIKVDLFEDTGFETEAGEPFWVLLPTRAMVGDLKKSRQDPLPRNLSPEERQRRENERVDQSNARILDYVIEWNLTDEDGKPVPTTRSIDRSAYKTDAEWHAARQAVVDRVPPTGIARIIAEVTGERKPPVSEGVSGN